VNNLLTGGKKMHKNLVLGVFVAILLFGQLPLMAGAVMDFDGDGKTDLAVNRSENGKIIWYMLNGTDGFFAQQWGQNISGTIDLQVPEDYDGDHKWDIAICRVNFPLQGQMYFYIYYSDSNTYEAIPWGLGQDSLIPQDYDGDGKADIAVTRGDASGLTWYIRQSRDGLRIERFGLSGDSPLRGDYDGDGKADLALYRRDVQTFCGDYTFYIERSTDGTWIAEQFGYAQADVAAPGDYDGDGKTDIAVWRGRTEFGNGVWYWHRSSDGIYAQIKWGTEVPPDYNVQGDYDGDGKTDVAIWRRGAGSGDQSYYYINKSSGGILSIPWGLGQDGPARLF